MSSQGRPPAGGGGRRPARPPFNPAAGAAAASAASSSAAGSPAPSSSAAPQRTGSGTHSLLPSRSPLTARPAPSRMLFRPKLPPRRIVKDEPDETLSISPMPSTPSTSATTSRPARPARRNKQPEMIASGPFAQGSGAASRSDHSRSVRSGPAAGATANVLRPGALHSGLDELNARMDYREPDRAAKKEREDYSDPEEDGVEIVDMEDVGQLDEMAPRSLPRMKKEGGKRLRSHTPREGENSGQSSREASVGAAKAAAGAAADSATDATARNADALDLSASEDEEVMDDLLEDFLGSDDGFDEDPENRLYLFQFPPLFPTFVAPPPDEQPRTDDNATGASPSADSAHVKPRRSVVFADDTVGGGGAAGSAPANATKIIKKEPGVAAAPKAGAAGGSKAKAINVPDDTDDPAAHPPSPEGQIGRLDVYRDGRVNFRFGDGLVMEVTGGSQSSFLQQVMIVDAQDARRATTLGEVHRKFVVAPEIASMLADADLAGLGATGRGEGEDEEEEDVDRIA